MKIKTDYLGNFSFSTTRDIDLEYTQSCDICYNMMVISKWYKQIIISLKKNGLLAKKTPYMCCDCYKILTIMGYIKCTECGEPLCVDTFEDKIYIKCSNSKCPSFTKVVFEGKKNISDLFKYNPYEVIKNEN